MAAHVLYMLSESHSVNVLGENAREIVGAGALGDRETCISFAFL